MVTNVNIPYFSDPPQTYNKAYLSQVTRSFSLFAQQVQNPGDIVGTALNLTNLPIYANNAAAITGGLAVNDVYKTATGELRIVV